MAQPVAFREKENTIFTKEKKQLLLLFSTIKRAIPAVQLKFFGGAVHVTEDQFPVS